MKAQKDKQLVAFGKHLQIIRKQRGFSQEGLAAKAGLARAYYGGVERGERNLAVLNLIKIASALEIEVGTLFPSLKELTSDHE